MEKSNKSEIIFLCFHYLKHTGDFKRIWGYDFELFKKNIDFLIQEFPPISFERFADFLNHKTSLVKACSVLTFDDGLKEHSQVIAPFLADKGISAIFSSPTCIFQGIMAPPQVIHFTTAKYGIRKFYQFIKDYFSVTGLNFLDYFDANWEGLEIFEFYGKIKQVLLYQMPHQATFVLLNAIFINILQKNYPHILEEVYLNEKDLRRLVRMGHQISCHTNSHFSLNTIEPIQDIWEKEIIQPKKFLETLIGEKINIFTYPYGSAKDKFDFKKWTSKLKEAGFDYGFNAFRNFNGEKSFDPFWIERYSVSRNDTSSEIKKNSFRYFF